MKDELFEAKHTLELVRYWARVYTCPDTILRWVYSWAEDRYCKYGSSTEDSALINKLTSVTDDLGLNITVTREGQDGLMEIAKQLDEVLARLSFEVGGLQNLVRAFEGRVAWLEVARSLERIKERRKT